MTMDEREMTSGVIPLRHASLPGHVKLPRRYEKAAMGSNGIPLRVRKISIQPGSGVLGDSLSDRLHDLTSAILWVKQELIMLRQHDILLKRQFFDIKHSIQSLQKPNTHNPTSTSTERGPSSDVAIASAATSNVHTILVNGEAISDDEDFGQKDRSLQKAEVNGLSDNRELSLDTCFVVRSSSSVTLLREDTEDEDGDEGDDAFCEDLFFSFRPRTSSMRTAREMAAVARRRGSKEFV